MRIIITTVKNKAGPKQPAAAATLAIPGIPLVMSPGAITGIIAAIPKMIGDSIPNVSKMVGSPESFSM